MRIEERCFDKLSTNGDKLVYLPNPDALTTNRAGSSLHPRTIVAILDRPRPAPARDYLTLFDSLSGF